jgi:hypothetical protein
MTRLSRSLATNGQRPPINWWGIASLVLFAAGYFAEAACLERGPDNQPRIYAITCYKAGLAFGLFALGSAIVATLRGSRFWLMAVFIAGWFSLASFMSEL